MLQHLASDVPQFVSCKKIQATGCQLVFPSLSQNNFCFALTSSYRSTANNLFWVLFWISQYGVSAKAAKFVCSREQNRNLSLRRYFRSLTHPSDIQSKNALLNLFCCFKVSQMFSFVWAFFSRQVKPLLGKGFFLLFFFKQIQTTPAHLSVLEMRSHSHPWRRTRRGHRWGVGRWVKVPRDQHHVVADVVLQFVGKRQIEHVVWREKGKWRWHQQQTHRSAVSCINTHTLWIKRLFENLPGHYHCCPQWGRSWGPAGWWQTLGRRGCVYRKHPGVCSAARSAGSAQCCGQTLSPWLLHLHAPTQNNEIVMSLLKTRSWDVCEYCDVSPWFAKTQRLLQLLTFGGLTMWGGY